MILHMFPGFIGIVSGAVVLFITWVVICRTTRATLFDFDAQGEPGGFEKLLPMYLRLAEFVLALAAGSIVLLAGSSAFRATGRLPSPFASPLFLLAISIICGVLFMVFLITDYETYRHHPESSYTRLRYVRNQTLGYGGLTCFCLGYVWLIVVVTA